MDLELPVSLSPDHISSTACCYLPSFYTSTKLFFLVIEAQWYEELAYSCHAAVPSDWELNP